MADERNSLILRILYLATRLGLHLPRIHGSVWFHGESPDQFLAAERLIDAVRKRSPDYHFVFTSSHLSTLTWLLVKYENDTVRPVPYDVRFIVAGFFNALAPRLIVLLESDHGVGRTTLMMASRAAIPLVALNIRRGSGPLPIGLTVAGASPTVFAQVCTQDEQTAAVIRGQGVPAGRITVTGDSSFDSIVPTLSAGENYYRHELGIDPDAPVIVAEKITPGEEVVVIDLLCRLRSAFPNLVLFLQPQHPRQLRRIESRLRSRGLPVVRRSHMPGSHGMAAVLFDRPGELPSLYGVATCVLAGGSFSGEGTTLNPVGPTIAGTPVVFGPHVGPEAQAVWLFIEHQASIQVSPISLVETVGELLHSPAIADMLTQKAAQIVKDRQGACERMYHAIEPLIPVVGSEPGVKAARRVEIRAERLGENAVWRGVAKLALKSRFDDWESLKARLGRPHAILCLGNGPSSEDPGLLKMEYDCLMRVNWRWKHRGLFTQPDIVFVGDPATVYRLPACIFAFWTMNHEIRGLLLSLLARGPGRMECFTMERISSLMRDNRWSARPTNGAMMIVAAAALQPERLIIAGVDLFLHPAGRYPGDWRGVNQYAPVHDRATELDIIRCALREFRGELVVMSDALRDGLNSPNVSAAPQ